jgi:hypothetical protein
MLARFVVASLLVPALPLAMASATARAGQNTQQRNAQCQGHFNANKAAIETLAMSGDSDGIKAIMSRGGCPASTVKLPARPQAKAASFKVECKTVRLYPDVMIDCTIGWLTMRKTDKR